MNPQEYFDYAVKRLCLQIKNELMGRLPSENGWICDVKCANRDIRNEIINIYREKGWEVEEHYDTYDECYYIYFYYKKKEQY